MSRIGVFVCHCGENISRTVDVEKVAEASRQLLGVAHACDYKYMCSDPGQTLLKNAVAEHKLDGVVVAEELHQRSPATPSYTQEQARRLFEEAGLVNVQLYNDFTREPASPEDSLFTLVGRKPEDG